MWREYWEKEIAKKIVFFLNKTLYIEANTNSSIVLYQLKIPENLKMFKREKI